MVFYSKGFGIMAALLGLLTIVIVGASSSKLSLCHKHINVVKTIEIYGKGGKASVVHEFSRQ